MCNEEIFFYCYRRLNLKVHLELQEISNSILLNIGLSYQKPIFFKKLIIYWLKVIKV